MEARAAFRGPGVSKSGVALVLVVVAVGLVAMAGYAAKGFTGTPASSSHQVQAAPANLAKQAAPANRLPAWIEQEITPKTAPRLLQDDIIRNAGPAAPAALPSWIMQEITPKTAARLLQDDIVRAAAATSTITIDMVPAGDW